MAIVVIHSLLLISGVPLSTLGMRTDKSRDTYQTNKDRTSSLRGVPDARLFRPLTTTGILAEASTLLAATDSKIVHDQPCHMEKVVHLDASLKLRGSNMASARLKKITRANDVCRVTCVSVSSAASRESC